MRLGALVALLAVTLVPPVTVTAQSSNEAVRLDDEAFEARYDAWHGDRHQARPWLAVGWNVALLAIGTGWYWSEKEANSLDWDYPSAWDRLNGNAVRFDDNRFFTNTLGHPVAGLGYYGMSRVSGLEPWQAALAAFLSSAVWEWGLEWREKVSINDQVFTPVGGVALGEVAYQLSEYLNSAPGGGSWANHLAAATIGFPRWIHSRVAGDGRPSDLAADELGFSANWWHRFRLGYALGAADDDGGDVATLHGMRATVELVSMPGFMQPGSFDVAFSHGNFTELTFHASTAGADGEEVDLRARSTLAGFYSQDVRTRRTGGVHGHGAMIGIGSRMRYTSGTLFGRLDRIGVVSPLGLTGELRLVEDPVRVRVQAGIDGDFAAVQSLAYADWIVDERTQGLRSVLVERGYYYGYGLSTHLRLEARLHGVELGASVRYGTWQSIEGLDRDQASVTRDIPMADDDLEYETWLGYTVPTTPLHLRLATSGGSRTSYKGGVRAERDIQRYEGSAGLSF